MRNGLEGRNPHDGLFSMDIEHTRLTPGVGSYLDGQGNLSDDLDRPHFLENVSCEDIMPQSSKVVVIDADLCVSFAFEALVDNSTSQHACCD